MSQGPEPDTYPKAIHAPWRLGYLEDLSAREKQAAAPESGSAATGAVTPAPAAGPSASGACFICDYWNAPVADASNHVIVRTPGGMILLNRYPYANGHLLVALGDGRPSLGEYAPEQRRALWELTDLAAELITRTLEPQGINIGVNQGRAAGAGVPQHLHVHLVPRWGGDVNFMAVVGNVRVIPSSLDVMASRFRDTWARMRTPAT